MFNEMKGVYSSPDSMFYRTVQQVGGGGGLGGVLFPLAGGGGYVCVRIESVGGVRVGQCAFKRPSFTWGVCTGAMGMLDGCCPGAHYQPMCCAVSIRVCVLQALFPDNTYSNDSGGDPAVIPELTFEQFQVCVSVCVSVCVLGGGDRGHRHIHPLACTCLCECLAGSKEGEGRL